MVFNATFKNILWMKNVQTRGTWHIRHKTYSEDKQNKNNNKKQHRKLKR